MNRRDLHLGYKWYYLFAVQSINMKIKKFGLAIIGGFDESGQSTTTVEVYDPIADKWTTADPLPQPLDHTAATSHDDKLYVVGGGYLSRDTLSNKLFIYDPTANKWTEGADLPVATGALTANFINRILYAVGGVDVSGTLN